jgi:hypothetical protein
MAMKKPKTALPGCIVAVDFDGTLVRHAYPAIGEAAPGAFHWLRRFQAAGARLILWTMRHGEHLDAAVAFCAEHEVEFWGVNTNPEQTVWTQSPKAYAHIYVDDAALGCPLVEEPDERPYVDWEKVGPIVLAQIEAWTA